MDILWIDADNRRRLDKLLNKTNSIEHLRELLKACYKLHESQNLYVVESIIKRYHTQGKGLVIKKIMEILETSLIMSKNMCDIVWDTVVE